MKKLTASILFLLAVLFMTPAFSAESVHLYLKGNRKAIKESKIIGNAKSTSLGSYSAGEYTISVPKDLIKPIAIDEPGVHKSSKPINDPDDDGDGVPTDSERKTSTGVKQTMQTQVRKSGSIIIMADGVEVARRSVTAADLDADGSPELTFSLGSDKTSSSKKWKLEVRVDRIEMK
jgi:hypothetical protein